MTTPEFSRLIEVVKLVDGESDLALQASTEEAARLAERFGLVKINRLEAQIHVVSDKSEGHIEINGTFEADIVQSCVVTLEPISASIKAPISRHYSNSSKYLDTPKEIDISGEDQDPPEPIIQGAIDVGEAIAEQLALEIDPFPRSQGIEFQGFSSDSGKPSNSEPKPDETASPFAVLAQLKGTSEN